MTPSPYKKRKIQGRTRSEHTVVWEEANGLVPSGYLVHHINEDKHDNRLENLELMEKGAHSRLHNPRIHPRIKVCEVCRKPYEPHITKRKRSKTCSWECRNELIRQASLDREARKRAKT